MPNFFTQHWRSTIALALVSAILLLVICVLAFIDWNMLRPVIARHITAKTGRAATIDGDLKVHLWSWNPTAEINGLTLKNPPWADRELMFGAKRITVSVSLGRLLRGQIVIPQIEMVEPVINLERDSQGRASWQLGTNTGTAKDNTKPAKIPAIRRLFIKDGRLHVVDEIRHLRFGGSLIADDGTGASSASAFKIQAKGSLNEKPFTLDAVGGPLLNLEPQKPYSFSSHVTASDVNLEAQITVAKPFDLGLLDVKFVVSGEDLADLYYLTGLALPNTPRYRFAASVHVDGTTITGDDFSGRLGSSDLSGKITVQTGGPRPKLSAKLTSKALNIVDLAPTLGHRADKSDSLAASDDGRSTSTKYPKATHGSSGHKSDSDSKLRAMLLPDADLQVNRVRGMDADVTYRAGAVTASKIPIKEVSLHVVLDNGLLTLGPLFFVLDQGKFAGNVHIDARGEVPETNIDMRIDDVNLGQFKTAAMKTAPLSGTLIGRLKVHGFGHSIHKFASSADGAMSFIIPNGEIDETIAELTGINVTRGLGLLRAPVAAVIAFIDPGRAKNKDCGASLSDANESIHN